MFASIRLFAAALLVGMMTVPPLAAEAPAQPNFVFILTDDQAWSII